MTRTKFWSSILAISVVLIAGSLAVSPIAIADDVDDDGEDEELLFRWNPDDTSEDLNNLIGISGSFSRIGFSSDITSDVQGEIEGELEGETDNEFTVTSVSPGTTTITTTVNSHSRMVDGFKGQITIDGEEFDVEFKVASKRATTLQVTDEFTGSLTQTSTQERLTIPVTIEMCDDNDKCFEGFGVIRRDSTITTTVVFGTVSFFNDSLEAELIGDTGLFQLNLLRFQKTIT